MTALRGYAPLRPSSGTRIPPALRIEVLTADNGCVGARIETRLPCFGAIELDHVRASGAVGKKSETVRGNLVSLCSAHHRAKTLNGRTWRPVLLAYIARRDGGKGETR